MLLPLSGRLEAAGKAVYEGVLEAFFEAYPDPRNRPQLFAVDTEGYADTLTAYPGCRSPPGGYRDRPVNQNRRRTIARHAHAIATYHCS